MEINENFFGFTQGQCRFNNFEMGFKIQHSEILRSDIPSKLLGYEFCHKMKTLEKKTILICFINSYTWEVLIDTDKINS